jgi:plastocyanin
MRKCSTATAVILAAAALAVGACGDDDEDATTQPATGGGQELMLSADPGGALKFDKDTLSTTAGKVTITLDNPSDVPHAIEVEGNGIEEEGETVQKGGTSTVTVDLKAGTYEYYCPVGNHEEEGMKGELTVK